MAALYDRDFYAWTKQAGELLRKGCFSQLDMCDVAEEIEDMGIAEKRALKSQMRRLVLHLAKWELQPQKRSSSWMESIDSARAEIGDILEHSPSLKPAVRELAGEIYDQAVKYASRETGLARSFPPACPYTIEQLLDDDFLPE